MEFLLKEIFKLDILMYAAQPDLIILEKLKICLEIGLEEKIQI